MTISDRIAEALQQKGIKQKTLSEALDVTASTVSTWFKQSMPSIPSAYVMPICRMLDFEPEYLLEGIQPEKATAADANGDQLSADEQKLLDLFRSLDQDSQILVMAEAVNQKRFLAAVDPGDRE